MFLKFTYVVVLVDTKTFENFFFLEMTPTPLFQAPNIPNPLFIEFTKTFIIHEILKILR